MSSRRSPAWPVCGSPRTRRRASISRRHSRAASRRPNCGPSATPRSCPRFCCGSPGNGEARDSTLCTRCTMRTGCGSRCARESWSTNSRAAPTDRCDPPSSISRTTPPRRPTCTTREPGPSARRRGSRRVPRRARGALRGRSGNRKHPGRANSRVATGTRLRRVSRSASGPHAPQRPRDRAGSTARPRRRRSERGW